MKKETKKCEGCGNIYTRRGISNHYRACQEYKAFQKEIRNNTDWYICVYVWEKKCWKCGKDTRVMHAQAENHTYNKFNGMSTNASPDIEKMKDLAKKHDIVYKEKYSHTMENSYWASVCSNCDALQGDHYLSEDLFEYYWVEGWYRDHRVYNIIFPKCEHDEFPMDCNICVW